MVNIFDYIEKISTNIGNFLGENETEQDKELYIYAIFGILSHIFTFGTSLIIATIFGCFLPCFLVISTFVLLRSGSGGYHCDKFKNCFYTSNFLFLIGVVFAFCLGDFPEMTLMLGIFSGVYIMPICPKPSKYSPSRGYKKDIYFRKKYRNYLYICFITNLIFQYFNLDILANSIIGGILITTIIVSDFGENLITNIWK